MIGRTEYRSITYNRVQPEGHSTLDMLLLSQQWLEARRLNQEVRTASLDIHYMAKSMWTPACPTSHSKLMGINMELVTPLLLQQPLLGRLSTRCWNIAAGICFHSATRA